MADETSGRHWRIVLVAVVIVGSLALFLSSALGRDMVGKFFASLRVQKPQAVNVDLSAFTDPNANPALHQMMAQMISDKVQVTQNENDQPAGSAAEASQVAGFNVQLLRARQDAPQLVVSGQHALTLQVDRARLQEIINEAGHPNIVLPQNIDGSTVSVKISRAVRAQYGTCPQQGSNGSAIANQITQPTPSTAQYSDCVRLTQGPSPTVNVPPGLDLGNLAEIGLEVGGMTPAQAQEFLRTVDWKATLGMSVPRFLRSYEEVKVKGVPATLLTMANRRGPGYNLIWAQNGFVYSLSGFGNSSDAVNLANSLN